MASGIWAQKPKKKPNRDVEVIDFGATDGDGNPKDEKAYLGLILKTSPVSFIFGSLPVELEKEINEYFSLQAGVGVTFEPLWTEYEDLGRPVPQQPPAGSGLRSHPVVRQR